MFDFCFFAQVFEFVALPFSTLHTPNGRYFDNCIAILRLSIFLFLHVKRGNKLHLFYCDKCVPTKMNGKCEHKGKERECGRNWCDGAIFFPLTVDSQHDQLNQLNGVGEHSETKKYIKLIKIDDLVDKRSIWCGYWPCALCKWLENTFDFFVERFFRVFFVGSGHKM